MTGHLIAVPLLICVVLSWAAAQTVVAAASLLFPLPIQPARMASVGYQLSEGVMLVHST